VAIELLFLFQGYKRPGKALEGDKGLKAIKARRARGYEG